VSPPEEPQRLSSGGSRPPLAEYTPKITDFGLAKRVEAGSSLTETGAIVGTPNYMAPEQARGKSAGRPLGPGVDIYALGVILYEMLTGRPPFQGESPLDTLQQVLTAEPVPPRRLQPKVPRDLETICLKCLEKQPEKRYPSAEALADDLHRFLAGEPIRARPVGPAGRLARWCRRKPVVAGLTAALLLVFLAGFAGVTWKWLEASAERDRAEALRDRAERNFQLAIDTNVAVGDLAEQLRPIAGVQSATVEKILRVTAANYDRLVARAGESPALLEGQAQMLNSFSDIYIELGNTGKALADARRARDLYARLLKEEGDRPRWRAGLTASLEKTGTALGWQGHLARCLAAYRESLALREKLVEEDGTNTQYQLDLSTSHNLIGNVLAAKYGDLDGGRKAYDRAFRIRKKLAEQHPKDLKIQGMLATSYEKVADGLWYDDKLRDALEMYKKAAGLLKKLLAKDDANIERHRSLARVLLSIGQTQIKLKDKAHLARGSFVDSLGIAERFARLNPDDVDWQRHIVQCRWNLADIRSTQDEIKNYKDQLATVRTLHDLALARARKDPQNAEWEAGVAATKWVIGLDLSSLARLGVSPSRNLADALAILKEAREMRERRVRQEPVDYPAVQGLSNTLFTHSQALQAHGDRREARAAYLGCRRVWVDFYTRQMKRDPDNLAWPRGLALAYRNLAVVLSQQKDFEAALTAHRKSQEWYEKLTRKKPGDWALVHELAVACQWVSKAVELRAQAKAGNDKAIAALPQSRDYAESLTLFRKSVGLLERLAAGEPDKPVWQDELAEAYKSLAKMLRLRGDGPGAAANFRRSLETLSALFEHHPAEARRDPFAPGHQYSTAIEAIRGFFDREVYIRRGILGKERLFLSQPVPDRGQELIDGYIRLVQDLAERGRARAAESRWALRRGLGLLRREQAAKRLHPVQQRLIPFFEAALKKLPPEKDSPRPPGELGTAWDGADYRRLAELFLERKEARDMVALLNREAKDAARVDWVRTLLPRWLVEALVAEPHLSGPVIQAARTMVKGDAFALDAEGRQLLATLARYGGDPMAAAELDPEGKKSAVDGEIAFVLYLKFRAAGRFYGAAQTLAAWAEAEPKNVDLSVHQELARVRMLANLLEPAAQSLQKALSLKANDVQNLALQGELLYRQRRFRQARDQLQRLVKQSAGQKAMQAYLRTLLALTLDELGEKDKAIAETDALLRTDQNNFHARALRAYFFVDRGKNLEEAEGWIREALKHQPEDPSYLSILGWVLAKRDGAEEGLKVMEKVSGHELNAYNPAFWEHLGDVYLQVERKDKAREAWKKALSLFPKTTDPADRRKKEIERKLKAL
jgi:tetratricopeptide (TPR) repeat protein